ncbi:MAG TPA: RHS repeat-associated core domain-containing protein, partial [Polyangiaceae bacterium]|nr:RHS repeat-associated core domain-containing protein [Polyangiaceae bacterium]
LGRLTSRCYRYMDGPERCYTATYDAANNPTTLTDPEMRRELSYDSLDRITEVKRFVPNTATTPSHVETYSYNALGGLAIHDGVALADQRPRLDGTGTASAGIPASLAGSPVGLDNGGRVTSLSGTNFTYYRYDNRLQNFVTGATTEGFAYDALLRTTELRRNGATVELYLRDDLSDNIAAVSNGTPGLAGMRRRIIWDGVDHPLWMFDADRGVTVYFELDTTGNVRRLHAGERITGNGSFTGDLGGYSYTAFGRNIPAAEPGGEATPKIDAVDYVQRLQWQGRWLYNRSGGLYDFRARFWSPQLGAFLQLDRYQFLASGGTLWSWPGQNPFRWRDPSGRIGFDGESTDRAIGADQDWGDPGFRSGMMGGGVAGAALGGVLLAGPVEFAVAAIRLRLSLMRAAAARAAAAALSAAIGGARACSDNGSSPVSSAESTAAKGAGRAFSSSDPLVGALANAIEKAYPGHVVGVNVPMRNAAGQLVTDADILLQNAVIQVKSGSGKGLTTQLLNTQGATNLPVIGYGPDLGGSVVKGIQANGGLVTRDQDLLIQLVAP